MIPYGSFAIILNPCSGAGKGMIYKNKLQDLCTKYGGTMLVSHFQGHSTQLARQAVLRKTPLIFAAGGDDTIREVLRGISFNSSTKLAILSLGTFNNFATSLHIPEDPCQALEETLCGVDKFIDVGKIENGPYFIESVGIGIDSEAWSRAPRQEPIGIDRWFTGIKLGFNALASFVPKHLHISIDNKPIDMRDVMQIIVANSSCFGARIRIAPKARLDDGLLDVCLIPPMSRTRLIWVLPLFFYGKQLDYLPSLRYYQCRKITIKSKKLLQARVDGLLAGRLPITIRSIPNSLPVRLPRSCFEKNN